MGNNIYERARCYMESSLFEDTVTFIRETMKENAYAERVESELLELEARLTESRVTGADLYFLKNVGVLVDCALQDYDVQDAKTRQWNPNFDRNCLMKVREAEKLKSGLAKMIQKVETVLVVESVADGGSLRVRLEEVRASLAGIIGDISGGGGEGVGKRVCGKVGEGGWTGGVRQTDRMSDLLEQMRAAGAVSAASAASAGGEEGIVGFGVKTGKQYKRCGER